ncbi:MAG TPA: glycosyltransferase family 4 protein [Acidimicrobiales bacterium]|nr:glycosyltransferase family 4 protein [Acidimicrobiales bacterium]
MHAVHQFIPSFSPRDAIGPHARRVQGVLRRMGLESEIYVDEAWPELAHSCRKYDTYRGRAGEVLLYQASTGSRLAPWLTARDQPLFVNYHNVTPPDSLERWEPWLADEVADGRRQIEKLAPATSFAISDSSYNHHEVETWGYRAGTVAPLLVDFEALDAAPDPTTSAWLQRLREKGPNLVFIGRIVPNKAQHHLVKALAAYHRLYGPGATLHLVGGVSSPRYLNAVRRLVAELGLVESVDVAGMVSDAEKAAYLSQADAFVCLSDHEGFCAPLLEAMHHDVPVIGFNAAAVPETLAGGGLILGSRDPLTVAAAVRRVVTDGNARAVMVEAGRRRVADFALPVTEARFAEAVTAGLDLLGGT